MKIDAHIVVRDAARAADWYARALGAEERSRIPLPGGKLTDPFGHRWGLAQHIRDVPHDEVVSAAAKAFGG
jgi:uncharacterized glyoxalase superfamily protein PhnB